MTRKTLWTMVCSIALTALASIFTLAQQGVGGRMGSPHYNPKTEVTVKGTVQEVKEYPSQGGGSHTGLHAILKTDDGSLEIRLGPTDYWKKNGFELTKGDSIEVIGSKNKAENAEFIIAREVKKVDKVITLRNAQGVPAWSGGRRSP